MLYPLPACFTTEQITGEASLVVYLFLLPQNTNNDKTKQLHKANQSGEEAQKETTRLIDIGLPQSKIIELTVTVRPGSKVKYNVGKYKLTNYKTELKYKVWYM